MPWPKGKKRKGHIKKNGSPAKAPGRKVYMSPAAAMRTLQAIANSTATGTQDAGTRSTAQAKIVSGKRLAKSKTVSSSVLASQKPVNSETPEVPPKVHGIGKQPVIEPCAKCGFAYADGGYCPECGQTTPIRIGVRIY